MDKGKTNHRKEVCVVPGQWTEQRGWFKRGNSMGDQGEYFRKISGERNTW